MRAVRFFSLLSLFIFTLTVASNGAPPAAVPGTMPTVADIVDRAARDGMAAQRLPGLVVLVAEHGHAVALRGYGRADVSAHVAATETTRFQIGSVTKQFTAACIMQLVDRRALSLDDRLGTYVPSYTNAEAVTIRELLGQTSGIPEYLGTLPSPVLAAHPVAFPALLAHVSEKPLAFAPGTQWQYSNTNYALLGRIIELVTHETYEHYVREHIFLPAHMTHSGFIGDGMPDAATARGYVKDGATIAPAPPLDETWAFAAGGIVSTAGDVLAWDNALLAGTIVGPDDVRLMQMSGTLPNGTPTRYGFGWIIDGTSTHPRVWHNGGTFGFSATNATYPSDDQTIVALTNLGFAEPARIVTAIFNALHPDAVPLAPTPAPGEDAAITARVREWFHRFQTGDVDRTQLAPQMQSLLTPDVIAQTKTMFTALGEPQHLTFIGTTAAPGDLTVYRYAAAFGSAQTLMTITLTADGKIAGFRVQPSTG